MNNKEREESIKRFLEDFGFETKIPDFVGAWHSKQRVDSFAGIVSGSYIVGFITSEESSIVVDVIGISIFDNPFTTEGIMVQKYKEELSFGEASYEVIRNYPNPDVKKLGFQRDFPYLARLEGDPIIGEFDIAGDDLIGFFWISKNDDSETFLDITKEIKEKLLNQIGGHGPLI